MAELTGSPVLARYVNEIAICGTPEKVIDDIQEMAKRGKEQIEKVKAIMDEIDEGATNVVNAVSHL